MTWTRGQLIWIETDQSSGPALIIADKDPQVFTIRFLEENEKRNYTKRNPPFRRVEFFNGLKIKVKQHPEIEITVDKLELRENLYFFESAQGPFSESDVIHISTRNGVMDLLRQKKYSPPKIFHLRRKAWELYHLRHQHPLRGAVGCRVQLLEHQLWVLDTALKMPRIRALLADEVGLGKTIEAGLIFSALHAREQLKKVLILVPNALKVQWLTECFRRFNIRFRLDHEELIEETAFRDFVIASLDEIDANRGHVDLLIVDEAHRLFHDEARSQKLQQLVTESEHVLFLSATPKVHGSAEFEKMMSTLGRTQEGAIQSQVFRSKRSELGIPCYREVQPVMVDKKTEWIVEFLRAQLDAPKKEKVFLIAQKAEDVLKLYKLFSEKLGQHFALFHENMDLVERDRQAAYFADPEGAPFLLSSEIGGEGRNFQFCHHMILVDLPADPLIVEQRIGRLDRLGQTEKVRVWCPVQNDSPDEEHFERHRDIYKVFEKPWSGSGLEDLSEKDLLSAKFEDSETPFQGSTYQEQRFAPHAAQALMASAKELEAVDIKTLLDPLYDLFGVEVEDFDTHGNWRVFTSSLMFVEYFPGLGESGERVMTFEREQSLAREDMTLFTLDHPEFMESLEFFLNSDHGKIAFAQLPDFAKKDVLFWFFHTSDEDSLDKLWSFSQKKKIPLDEKFSSYSVPAKVDALPRSFFESLSDAAATYIGSQNLPKESLEAIMVFVPKN